MAFFIGAFVGGFFIIWMIALPIYKFSKADKPTFPVVSAWAIVGLIATFGFMDRGAWSPLPALYYAPSALAVLLFLQWRESKTSNADDLDDTFS